MKSYATCNASDSSRELVGSRVDVTGVLAALGTMIGNWRQRAETRRQLAQLDARALKDLGIDPVDAHIESTKPFWRP